MYNFSNGTREIPNLTSNLKPCTPCSVKNNKILPNSNEKNAFTNIEARRPQYTTSQINSQTINFNSNTMNTFTNQDTKRPQNLTSQFKNQPIFSSNMMNTFTNPDTRGPPNSKNSIPPNFNSNLMNTSTNLETRRPQSLIPPTCTPCSVKNEIQSNFSQIQDERKKFQENIRPFETNQSRNNTSNSYVKEYNMDSTTTANMGFNSGLDHTVALKSSDFDELIQAFSPDNQEINKSKKLPHYRGKASFQIKKLKNSDFDDLMRVLADDHCSDTNSDCSSLCNETVKNDKRKSSKLKLECSGSSNQTDATNVARYNGGLNKPFLVDNGGEMGEKMSNSLSDSRKVGKLSGDCCKTPAPNETTRNSDYDELIQAFSDEIKSKNNQETPNFEPQFTDKNGKLGGRCCGGSKTSKTAGYDRLIGIFSNTNNNNRLNEQVSNEVQSKNEVLKPEYVDIPEKSDVMKTLKAQQNIIENNKLNTVEQIEEDFISSTSASRNSGMNFSDNIDEILQVFSGKSEDDFNNMTIDDPQCQKCPSKRSFQEKEEENRKGKLEEDEEMKSDAIPKSKSEHVMLLLNKLAPTPLQRIPSKKDENKEELPLMNEQINWALKRIQEADKRAGDLFLSLISREKQCPNRRRQKRLQNVMRKLSKGEETSEKGKSRPEFSNPNIQRSIMNTKRLLQKKAARRYSCKDSPIIC